MRLPVLKKFYIGDSVYMESDGDEITLTTENGFGPTNTIHLDFPVFMLMTAVVKQAQEKEKRDHTNSNEVFVMSEL